MTILPKKRVKNTREERSQSQVSKALAQMRISEKVKKKDKHNVGNGGGGGGNGYPELENRGYRTIRMNPPSYILDMERARMEFDENWKNSATSGTSGRLDDFQILRTIGTGAFGRVLLVMHRISKNFYAMKVQEKDRIVRNKQVENTINERRILNSIDFPFLVSLRTHFKDNSNVYMIMDFIKGGELFTHLRRAKRFSEYQSMFYASQIVLAFEYLHSLGIVYRDLKPENLLIDYDGYIKIADFGFTKKIDDRRTWTLCGTPEYLAPEIVLTKGYSTSVDFWALGILIYEMCCGAPPFYRKDGEDQMLIYERIVNASPKYPNFLSQNLTDLLKKLIQVDLSKRIGNLRGGVNDIKEHRWFGPINWNSIYYRRVEASFVPKLKEPGDSKYFDQYKEEQLHISQSDKYANEFANF